MKRKLPLSTLVGNKLTPSILCGSLWHKYAIWFLFMGALLLSFGDLAGQQMNRVREVTDSLCAPYMNGRGYTYQGDKLAANFIKKQFDQAGLSYFKQGAFQRFSLDVNTFPKEVALELGGKRLQVGKEFIVYADAPRQAGSGRLFYLDSNAIHNSALIKLPKKMDRVVLAYRKKDETALSKLPKKLLNRLMQAQAQLIVTEKLTHWVAKTQTHSAKFLILASAFDAKAAKVSFAVDARMRYGYQTQNVIAYSEGTHQPDSFLVFTAHYDHLGNMGKEAYFPGANDNASGVAMLLELARHYAKNPSKYSIAFIAFGAEEAGLVGSRYYTSLPYFSLQRIKFLTNLDLFATGEKGMTVVNGSLFERELNILQAANEAGNYLPTIGIRGEAANSDHYFFYLAGVRCFFFYLQGAWTNYHDVYDDVPIPYTKFSESFRLLVDFADALAE